MFFLFLCKFLNFFVISSAPALYPSLKFHSPISELSGPRGGGGNSSLVLVGTCCWEFEIGPIQVPTFPEKVTHSYNNRPDLEPNFDQNYQIFFIFYIFFFIITFEPILALCLFVCFFFLILKNWPISYFASNKGSLI